MGEGNVDYIAWWGAGLSTLLALTKLWELWRDRFRIEIGFNFTDDPEQGHDIFIRNLSGTPMILSFWELFYRPRLWPLKKDSEIGASGVDTYDLRIEPHSSKSLGFKRMEHFDWGWKAMKGRSICIRLYIAGRPPVVKRVYPP